MPLKTMLKNIGGTIRTVTEFVEDEVIDRISNELEYGVDEFRQGNPAPVLNAMSLGMSGAMAPLTQAVRGVDETEGTLLESVGNFVEDKTGIPSLVTQVAAGTLIPGPGEYKAAGKSIARGVKKAFPLEGLDNIARGGPPTPQLATAGVSPSFPTLRPNYDGASVNLTPQVLNLTATKNLTDVVVPGVGSSEKYKIGVQKLRNLQATGIKKRANFQKQLDNKEITQKQYNSRIEKLKKTEDAKYSTLATEDDPDIFETRSQIQRDPTNPNLPSHQHHATGKAMTSPWVQTALELGDDDDVVALFELHKKLLDSGMGNVKSGIIDMPGFAHIARDARMPEDVPMSVHSFMKKSGADIEIVSKRVREIIGKPKNMDELMDKYITFAEEYLIPQKNLSLKRLNQVLTEHKKTLSPAQQVKFDKLVSKLNKANT